MRFADLHPQFVNAGGAGITRADGSPAPARRGIGVLFDCPCGNRAEDHQCYVAFVNPLDGGPAVDPAHPIWTREGETFETLTLRPSVFRPVDKGGCGLHVYVIAGEVTSC